jgi:glycine cleavage system H protein
MENSTPTNKYPLVPPNEQKCVWMTAGILSYQLCDREFDCDHCPLDSAIRTFPERPSTSQRPTAMDTDRQKSRMLSPGYIYSRKHCWIKSNDGGTVRVGIEPVLSSMLLNLKTVVLPSIGDHLQAGKVCSWVVLEGGTLAISSPLDGDVCGTNAVLVDQPYDIRNNPFEKGWLFDLRTNEDIFNLSSLLRIGEAEKRYAEDERRFHSLVNAELKKHRATAGVTLADGGQVVEDVAAMLGPEKYFLLLSEVFV